MIAHDLLGSNLVRLLYIDEAGKDFKAPALTVAGVMVHGDNHPKLIDQRLREVRDKYVDEEKRSDFVFHAKDVYHGTGYWDRDRWTTDQREDVLTDLALILTDLDLPVVLGSYQKQGFWAEEEMPARERHLYMQTAAALDCAMWADRWLAQFQPNENAMIIAEDADHVKQVIRVTVQVLRRPEECEAPELRDFAREYQLPLKRIVDTVYFTDKQGSAHLQLADLCAFLFSRMLCNKSWPFAATTHVVHQAMWMRHSDFSKFRQETIANARPRN